LNQETSNDWRLRQRAEVEGGEVAFDVFGQGPPVVLVHGTPTWSYLWRNVVPVLAEQFTVYVFDLFGYGDSKPKAQDVSIGAQSHLLTGLIERWGLEAPAIAGHDIGGAIALRSHLLDGVPYSRIALIDAVVLRPWITPTTRHVQANLEVYRTMPTHIFERIVAGHIGTAVHRPMDEETFAAYFDQWRGENGQAIYLQKVAQFDEGYTDEFEPLLGSVQSPVRIIWGEQDAWLDPTVAGRLHELLPTSELALIPDAGHFVMEDAPEEVVRELRDFFAADIGPVSYLEQPLGSFLDLVASDEPAPGGGATAALTVALAASLSSMAARLSTDYFADATRLIEHAEHLRHHVAPLAQDDAEAYGRVMAAQRDGAEDRIRAALSEAADVPLAVAECAAEVAGISARLVKEGNPNLRGDAAAAALLAEAGVRAATTLVKINLTAAEMRDDLLARADELIEQVAATRHNVEAILEKE
jgi:pimeloyl-ACP methyl ester carboxylesterase/formiminotetrahydrofolate cyclodeaminase